jgi:hypothetical protein
LKVGHGSFGTVEVNTLTVSCPTYFHSFRQGPHEIHRLIIDQDGDRSTWMSDSPQEVQLARMDVAKLPGGAHILVVGLGLGVFPQLVEKKYQRVTVLELNPAVVTAVWSYVKGANWHLKVGDAWEMDKLFIRGTFDAVYGDIWSEICRDTREEYKRFKKLARYRLGSPKTVCWVEDHVYGWGDWFG